MAYLQTCKSVRQLCTMMRGKAGLNASNDTGMGWYQGNLTHVYICWLIENLIFSLLLQKIKSNLKPSYAKPRHWAMTLRCLYAAMKIFTILIWNIQCFYRVRRNRINLSIEKASESRERQGIRTRKELWACVCVSTCLPVGHITLCVCPWALQDYHWLGTNLLGDIFCTLFLHVTFCHILSHLSPYDICHFIPAGAKSSAVLCPQLKQPRPPGPLHKSSSSVLVASPSSPLHQTSAPALTTSSALDSPLDTWCIIWRPLCPYWAPDTGCLILTSYFLSGIS